MIKGSALQESHCACGAVNIEEPGNKIEAVSHTGENAGKKHLIRPVAGAVLLAAGAAAGRLFDINGYISLAFYILAYLLSGGPIVLRAVKNITKGKVFDENFLMTVATIGAFILGEYAEAVGVMLFYRVGEFFQDSAVRKSKNTIVRLTGLRPDYANLYTGGEIKKVAPEDPSYRRCDRRQTGRKNTA